ncbi:MAG: ribose 5-phosphate isomerase A [Thermoplasmata archaeon]|nr:ribose 5-phosphate isomerase A [Thermoplasmata archaeon]
MGTGEVEAAKQSAGIAACDFVHDGMDLGLGTGSTVRYTVIELGRRISEEGLNIRGVPTSIETEILANEHNIPLIPWNQVEKLDLTIDGADEFDPEFHLIKGGGGALTREKIVAKISHSMVVVTDPRKDVEILGNFPLPVEVIQFGWEVTSRHLQKLCPGDVKRRGGDNPFITDNGNYILDCNFGPTISNPVELENKIQGISGVLEVGLFTHIADAVVIGSTHGIEVRIKPSGRLS